MQLFKFFQTESTSENTNSKKMVAFVNNCLVKITSRLFQAISVVMNMMPILLRQFRRLAQGYCSEFALVALPNLTIFFRNPPTKTDVPHLKNINIYFFASKKLYFGGFQPRVSFSIFNEMLVYRPGCNFRFYGLTDLKVSSKIQTKLV